MKTNDNLIGTPSYPANLQNTLENFKSFIQDARNNGIFCIGIHNLSINEAEKSIISSIIKDKREDIRSLISMHGSLTGSLVTPEKLPVESPSSYVHGLEEALEFEFELVASLNKLLESIPDINYKHVISKVLSNELKHIGQFNYLLYKNINLASKSDTQLRQMKSFTLEELSGFNGSNGKPAYVSVDGVVYDVSKEATWGGATHFGLYAGNDLTAQFKGCHNKADILSKLPKVGVIKY